MRARPHRSRAEVAAGVLFVIGPAIGLLIFLDQRSLLKSPEG
jgi:hypothetical protein